MQLKALTKVRKFTQNTNERNVFINISYKAEVYICHIHIIKLKMNDSY